MAERRAGGLEELVAAHRACTRCADAGLIAVARPVFSGRPGQRILLVGQAPGPVEHDVTRPFAGRAGRELVRWMLRAGFRDEEDFRARVWITSTTTCFPGRRPDGSGDRRPTPAEVALCAPWLDAVHRLLAPRLVLPVGGLALSRLLPAMRLDDAVGRTFDAAGAAVEDASPGVERLLLPLPHPSGQSRWLNDPERRRRLEAALRRLGRLLDWSCDTREPLTPRGDAKIPRLPDADD
ncbi:MAG TPA: uracil-DNA glycosylase family protein [Candidatus Dormibacteraeota bacterium]|nr:uracil-DNA glycosylase family protein [Candidatus Dormibacteraeota bacterium]